MMKNFWRQFEVWVIKSKDDPFIRSRLHFTLTFFLALLGCFLVARFVFAQPIPFLRMILISISAAVASYFLSTLALGPLRNIVRAQKRFIADASHELRTPLSIIRADSEIALLDGLTITPENAITTLKSNLEEVERMSKIIESLLSLSFYENKVVRIPFTRINIRELVENFVQKAKSLALKEGVELYISHGDDATVYGNATAIEQMTMNLIRNAILYTPKGGTVNVAIKNTPRSIELLVADTGIGISQHDLPNIFNPFYRAGESNHKGGSSGLGLTIVKRIVDRHNALINVSSILGHGTTFTISFPKLN